MRTSFEAGSLRIAVTYRPNDTLGFWVPVEMKERYVRSNDRYEGTATYTNFRRFQVLTDKQLKAITLRLSCVDELGACRAARYPARPKADIGDTSELRV